MRVLSILTKRVAQAMLALLALSLIVFVMSRATGDPRALLLTPQATAEEYEALGREMGLDRPLPVQYGIFLTDALSADLGRSYHSRADVTELLVSSFPATAELGLAALAISLGAGIPLGVLAAIRKGSWIDRVVKTTALFGQSTPSFWLGIVLIQLASVSVQILPAGTRGGIEHLILPSVTLAAFGIAATTRLVRSSMLDVLDSDYVMFARLKGLSEPRIVVRYALRNALIPVVSFSSAWLISLISLAVVVETVFAWPGVGLLTFKAVLNRDFPVIQAVVLAGGALAIAINLVQDLIAMYLDPRVRHAVHQ